MSPHLKFAARAFIIKNMFGNSINMLKVLVEETYPEYTKLKFTTSILDQLCEGLYKEMPKPLLIKALIELGLPQNTLAEWFGISDQAVSQHKNNTKFDEKYEDWRNNSTIQEFTNTLPTGVIFEGF